MKLKILILCHEQRQHYTLEPAYFELVLPLSSVAGVECIPYPYQRISSINDPEKREFLLDAMYKDITALCELHKPNIIFNTLTWHHECIPGYILKKIRVLCDNLVTIYFDHDESNLRMLSDERTFFENSKLNIFVDSPNRVKRINKISSIYSDWENKKSATFTPLPVDPQVFKSIEDPINRVAIIGSQEGNRIFITNHLKSINIPNLHTAGSILDKSLFLSWHQYASEIYSSLINIVTSTQSYRSQIKGRSFQVISTGTCLLEETNEDNKDYFSNDFIWFWKNFEELESAIDQIRTSPKLSLEKAKLYKDHLQQTTLPEKWIINIVEKLDMVDK